MRSLASLAASAGLGLALACGLASGAGAQQPSQAQASAIRSACRADYQAHCASVPAGGSAALACLQQNAASLSGGCQQALAAVSGAPSAPTAAAPAPAPAPSAAARPAPPRMEMSPRQEIALVRQACGMDYRAFCGGIRPGQGRAVACLRAHETQLSRQCRTGLGMAMGGR